MPWSRSACSCQVASGKDHGGRRGPGEIRRGGLRARTRAARSRLLGPDPPAGTPAAPERAGRRRRRCRDRPASSKPVQGGGGLEIVADRLSPAQKGRSAAALAAASCTSTTENAPYASGAASAPAWASHRPGLVGTGAPPGAIRTRVPGARGRRPAAAGPAAANPMGRRQSRRSAQPPAAAGAGRGGGRADPAGRLARSPDGAAGAPLAREEW